jgi:hypothetical protein
MYKCQLHSTGTCCATYNISMDVDVKMQTHLTLSQYGDNQSLTLSNCTPRTDHVALTELDAGWTQDVVEGI